MFAENFYFGLIRKYVVLFGTLFDNINIQRKDANNNIIFLMKVPLTYANKDKMLARVLQDPTISNLSATEFAPIMSFEIIDMRYRSDSVLKQTGRIAVANTTNSDAVSYQFNPTAYDIIFKLMITAKNTDDMTQIIEQILPYFTPGFTINANLIPEMNVNMAIPIVLNEIKISDNYNPSFTKRSVMIYELNFTMKAYFYGPVRQSAIIKFVETNFRIANTAVGDIQSAIGITPTSAQVIVTPGLTANGLPTSNSSLSIPYRNISINEDYGFITNVNENF